MTPMELGIRVTSGVELTGRDAPSSFAQLDQVVPLARSVAEFGDAVGETWRGSRPTLPDGLPMIGVAPRHAGLWLAFGNQHIGFTTGPATGAAIAAMIDGAPPSYDVTLSHRTATFMTCAPQTALLRWPELVGADRRK